MHPSLVSVEGLNIALYEKGNGTPVLFLIHGNSSNANAFQDVWNDSQLEAFRLIAIDLPGHGKSELSSDASAYNFKSLGKIIARIIQIKELRNVVLIGHSIGGHIAASTLRYCNEIAGVCLTGTAPLNNIEEMSDAYNLSDVVSTVFRSNVSDEDITKFASNAVYKQENREAIIEAFHNTDKTFRSAIGSDIPAYFGGRDFISEIELLKGRPVCLIAGAEERVLNLDYLQSVQGLNLFKRKVQVMPETGHCPPIESPREFSAIVHEFVGSIR